MKICGTVCAKDLGVILAPSWWCSARYMPIPPKITINDARIVRTTISMFVFSKHYARID